MVPQGPRASDSSRRTGEDVFVTSVKSLARLQTLNAGDKVGFEVTRGPKGSRPQRYEDLTLRILSPEADS
jgi:hypothetical protein